MQLIPHVLDAVKAAKEGLSFKASLPLARFSRFLTLVAKAEGEIKVELSFFVDEAHLIHAMLRLDAPVSLTCQACNGLVSYAIVEETFFQFAKTDAEAEALPLQVQALVLDETGNLNVDEMLEDALILALPMFPRHEKKDCSLKENRAYYASPREEAHNTYKPFTNLEELVQSKEKKIGGPAK